MNKDDLKSILETMQDIILGKGKIEGMATVLILVFASFLLIFGCASTSKSKKEETTEAEYERGKLSEAMRKAKKKKRSERQVRNSMKIKGSRESNGCLFGDILEAIFLDNSSDSFYDGERESIQRQRGPDVERADDRDDLFGISLVSGMTRSEINNGMIGFSLVYASDYKKGRNGIELGFVHIPTTENSPLYGSIEEISDLFIGYHHKFLKQSDAESMNPYFLFRIKGKLLYWRYTNSIFTDVYDEDHNFLHTQEIKHDDVFGFSPEIGGGVLLLRSRKLDLSCDLAFGGSIYAGETNQSFENDVFRNDLFLRLTVELLIGKSD